jgi:hypothetical protein
VGKEVLVELDRSHAHIAPAGEIQKKGESPGFRGCEFVGLHESDWQGRQIGAGKYWSWEASACCDGTRTPSELESPAPLHWTKRETTSATGGHSLISAGGSSASPFADAPECQLTDDCWPWTSGCGAGVGSRQDQEQHHSSQIERCGSMLLSDCCVVSPDACFSIPSLLIASRRRDRRSVCLTLLFV